MGGMGAAEDWDLESRCQHFEYLCNVAGLLQSSIFLHYHSNTAGYMDWVRHVHARLRFIFFACERNY